MNNNSFLVHNRLNIPSFPTRRSSDLFGNSPSASQNNGTMEATNGGIFFLRQGAMEQTGGGTSLGSGVGSVVRLSGTVVGGTLNTTSSGVIQVQVIGSLVNATNSGRIE